MTEERRNELLLRFYERVESILNSDLPKDRKIACIEALYIAYCTAVGKEINYKLLNNH